MGLGGGGGGGGGGARDEEGINTGESGRRGRCCGQGELKRRYVGEAEQARQVGREGTPDPSPPCYSGISGHHNPIPVVCYL